MNIKKVKLSFNPAQCKLYFVIKTKYDKKQISDILRQINQLIFGSSANCEMPLNTKQRIFINTHPQQLYNTDDMWMIQSSCGMSKIQKVVDSIYQMQNVEVAVQQCYIVQGGKKKNTPAKSKKTKTTQIEDGTYKPKLVKKPFVVCQPENCLEGYQPKQDFRAKNQDELIALVSYFQNGYKIKVEGTVVSVFPTIKQVVRQPPQAYMNRMLNKCQTILKKDLSVLKTVNELCFGIY